MPWSWECRAKFVKQTSPKPTARRGEAGQGTPGPLHYQTPRIFCGKGYSNIKRAPAFSFGQRFPAGSNKPVLANNAPLLNLYRLNRKGPDKITNGLISPRIDAPKNRSVTPGPAEYAPRSEAQPKHAPAYSIRPQVKPAFQSKSTWTPSPNMYLPEKSTRKAPAYSFPCSGRDIKERSACAGDYYPKFNYVQRTTPGFSFGGVIKALKQPKLPSPNAYCEKKFMYPQRSAPTPSFGIRHSPYLGSEREFLKPTALNIEIYGESVDI
ncbi:outer dense fiber protein 3-like [Aricia agestis]|uniref:outer dense fiber protein 3-like n=1 Tax=Aricia agestis TaxID=91739 RepID=UPI001C2060CA|nr:outer dense fiber protein 3-like [Aricia agestis]